MSTNGKKFPFLMILCAEILLSVFVCSAQEIEVNIKKISSSPAIVRVEGRFLQENLTQSNKNLAFASSVGNVENLGTRISDLNLTDKQGRAITFKKLIEGEYLTEDEANAWSYQVNLNTLPNEKALAHVSWAMNEQGILMLGDLLPQFVAQDNQPISAKIKFELPKDWKILSSEKSMEENTFFVNNIEKAVFLIGKNWR
ncbi:MAG: hypothetical protein H0W58_18570, partial [Acidobacteria bacterium]|nr:hypothetical protein [Acidobacteriota bacterium]